MTSRSRPWSRSRRMVAQPPVAAKTPASPGTSGTQSADTLNSSTGALLRVDMVGPEAITIGEAALLSVRLSNLGATEAQNASVRVVVPKHLELVSTEVETGSTHTQPESVSGSILVWAIDRIPARAERRMTLKVVPRTAAPLELPVEWSVAPISTVARIQVQQPRLELSLHGPDELVFGDTKMFTVTVSNPGSGEAKQVALRLALGDESADTLQIGTIPAGISRKYEVEVTARQAGQMTIQAVVQGANDLQAETQQRIQVRRADLKIEALGSAMKYAGSVGTYQVRVANQGDAAADNVQAVVRLPASAQYVQGLEDAKQQGNELAWSVGRLAAGEERTFRFFCQLNQEGNARFDIAIRNEGGSETVSSLVTRVEAIADLKMTVNDPKSPVPVGEEVLYEIQIANRGTKAATQVQVVAQFSDGIEPVSVEGSPAEHGVGSRFRPTINHMESRLAENDSRPLPPIPSRNTWPGGLRRSRGVRTGAAACHFVAQFRCQFVLFRGHRFLQSLFQGAPDAVVRPERFAKLHQPHDQAILLEILLGVVFGEQFAELFQAFVQFLDRRFGCLCLQFRQRTSLDAMKQYERPVLLVRDGPLLVRRMIHAEIHHRQRVIGILDRPVECAKRQPTHSPMIKLDELPVDFGALLVGQFEIFVQQFFAQQVVVKALKTERPIPVRAPVDLHLQDAHVHPHLDHVAAVVALNNAHLDRVRLVWPLFEQSIQILLHRHCAHAKETGNLHVLVRPIIPQRHILVPLANFFPRQKRQDFPRFITHRWLDIGSQCGFTRLS
jgi:uncharacterized repeat protein (TIGR01451 family)